MWSTLKQAGFCYAGFVGSIVAIGGTETVEQTALGADGGFSQVISVGKSAPLDGIYKLAICTAMRIFLSSWWRHQMETFSALLALCAGNSPVPGEFPAQWPVTRSFCAFCDVRLNKRLSKQSWGWWFETLSRPLWRHRNDDDCNIR